MRITIRCGDDLTATFAPHAMRSLLCVFALAFSAMPTSSLAQERKQVREQAMVLESQMRAFGEPRDRCSLGANIHDGPVVIRASQDSALKPGDRIILLNRINLEGKSPDDVISMLREMLPTAQVQATVDRGGQLMDVELQCVNSRPTIEPMINALSFAARGKFDDCVDTISRMSEVDTRAAMIRAQCAAVSRDAKRHNVPALLAQVMSMAIEDATNSPSMRPEVVKQLRSVEAQITQGLGAGRFQSLVASTKSWPGGEREFGDSAPDWLLFRRNSENALRSRLIDPDSARIEWTHGFLLGTWKPFMSKRIEGYWSCGRINARNRMGGFTGSTSFVVVLDSVGYVQYSEIGDSKEFDLLSASCGSSVKLLPPAPAELRGSPIEAYAPIAAPLSVADEIKKLVDLRDSGALSEAEFQAAKQRLLGALSQ